MYQYRIYTETKNYSFLDADQVVELALSIGTSEQWTIEKWNGTSYSAMSEAEFTALFM